MGHNVSTTMLRWATACFTPVLLAGLAHCSSDLGSAADAKVAVDAGDSEAPTRDAGAGAIDAAGNRDASAPATDGGGTAPPTPTECSATRPCFYVTETGAGTKDGSSWANAFAGLPTSGQHPYQSLPIARLTRGATYLFADGRYPGYVFGELGASTLPITLRKATVADHGASVGWADALGDGEAVFSSGGSVWVFSPRAHDYVFDGRVGRGKAPGQYGFRLFSTASRSGPSSSTYMVNIDASGAYADVGDVFHIAIEHVEFDWNNGTSGGPCAFAAGLQVHGAKPNGDFRVAHSYIHHASGGAAYLRNGSDYVFDDDYFQAMGDETNSGACPGRPDHGHWETFWFTVDKNVTITNSTFEDAFASGQTGWIMLEANSVRIENNLLFCSAPARCAVGGNGVIGAWSASTNNDVLITGNTFRDFFNGGHFLFEKGTNIVIRGNTYLNAPGLADR